MGGKVSKRLGGNKTVVVSHIQRTVLFDANPKKMLHTVANTISRYSLVLSRGRIMELCFFMGLVTPLIHFGMGHTVRTE